MQNRVLVLNAIVILLTFIAWILSAASIAVETWTDVTGSTKLSSDLGGIALSQEFGVFTTRTTQCCRLANQVVADLGIVCPSASQSQCQTESELSRSYCRFVNKKLGLVNRGLPVNCSQVEIGSVVTAVAAFIAMIILVVLLGLFAAQKITCGIHAGALCVPAVLSIVVMAAFYGLCHKNISNFMKNRYASSQDPVNPIDTSLGRSYDLTIASFVFQLLSIVAAAFGWYFRPKRLAQPEPVAVVRETTQFEPVVTPERSSRVSRSVQQQPSALAVHQQPPLPTSQRTELPVLEGSDLPLCPMDTRCGFYSNFGHQLEFVHTCRDPICTNYSVAHCQHFLHDAHPKEYRQPHHGDRQASVTSGGAPHWLVKQSPNLGSELTSPVRPSRR